MWQDSLDFYHQLHKCHLHDQNTQKVRKNTAFNLTTQNVHRFSVVSVNTSLMQPIMHQETMIEGKCMLIFQLVLELVEEFYNQIYNVIMFYRISFFIIFY